MRCTFYKWYSQALGSTLGIIACIFGYLNGYMFVYTNIENNFDYLGFDGIVSSYLLLPMCILTLLFSIIRVYYEQEKILGIPFQHINNFLIAITIILGFLGTKMYFTIPCTIIIIGFISFSKIKEIINKSANVDVDKEAYEYTYNQYSKEEVKLLITRQTMALELIEKKASIDFIKDITGFTDEEIEKIKNT